MKTRLLLVAALLALLLPARARASVSFEFFFNTLDPMGEWLDVGDYGYCWRPHRIDRDWRPYSDGYWTYTDAGWTWVSYEDWGGITYHYGRWVYLEYEGWCWVPGYEWGPAWVSWRSSDDYIGWAPLPPEVRFRPSIGISIWVDRNYDIGPSYYNFCQYRNFGAPVMRGVLVDRRENVTIINQTVNITNITVNKTKKVVYNGGPDYERVKVKSERQVPTLKLVQETAVDGSQPIRARQREGELVVAAPEVQAPVEKVKLPKPAKIVTNARVDKGWRDVKDAQTRQRIEQRLQTEAAGLTPENAPAKPVETDAVVPEQGRKPREAQQLQSEQTTAGQPENRRFERKQRNQEQGRPAEANQESLTGQVQENERKQLQEQRKAEELQAKALRRQQEESARAERQRQEQVEQEQRRQAAERQKAADQQEKILRQQQEQAKRAEKRRQEMLESQQRQQRAVEQQEILQQQEQSRAERRRSAESQQRRAAEQQDAVRQQQTFQERERAVQHQQEQMQQKIQRQQRREQQNVQELQGQQPQQGVPNGEDPEQGKRKKNKRGD